MLKWLLFVMSRFCNWSKWSLKLLFKSLEPSACKRQSIKRRVVLRQARVTVRLLDYYALAQGSQTWGSFANLQWFSLVLTKKCMNIKIILLMLLNLRSVLSLVPSSYGFQIQRNKSHKGKWRISQCLFAFTTSDVDCHAWPVVRPFLL